MQATITHRTRIKAALSLACLLALAPIASRASAAELTAAEVETASGLKGIQPVAANPAKGFGGAMNFADATGAPVLTVMVEPPSTLAFWKERYKTCEKIAELGADGCAARTDPVFGFMLGYVYFEKGGKAYWLQQLGNRAGNVKAPNIDRSGLLLLAKTLYGKL